MAAELYNGWYISANQYDVGPSSGTPTSYQESNVDIIHSIFSNEGWTVNAIAGMVGNMMYESCIDPACAYPSIGSTLAGIDNTVASQHPDNAYGLVQWKGRGSTDPSNNQLVGYAIRHNYEWYDGEVQMNRLVWEYNEPAKFHPQTVDGVYYTFASYAASTESAEQLAKVWMVCYEGTYSVLSIRKANAVTWYNYLSQSPGPGPTPTEWITGTEFATLALAYNGQYIPYSQMDCIQFVQAVWRDITAVQSTWTVSNPLGTNSWWRQNTSQYPSLIKTFNTTSPDNQNPTPTLWYKDTISNCISMYGEIPTGSLLFHKIGDDDNPQIPSTYRGDGIGNFAHVGIYCGNNQVMQSGGRDSSQVAGGGVHLSTYDPNAWNYVAWVAYVDPGGTTPGPGPGPGPLPTFDYKLLYYFKKKVNMYGKHRRINRTMWL